MLSPLPWFPVLEHSVLGWGDGSVLLCKHYDLRSILSTHIKARRGDTIVITSLEKQRQADRFLRLNSQPV